MALRPLPGSTWSRPRHSIQAYSEDLARARKRRSTVLGWLARVSGLGGIGEVESADEVLGVIEDSLSSRMSGTRSAGWQ